MLLIEQPRDTAGRFSEKEGQAPEVNLDDHNIPLHLEDGEEQTFGREDLGDPHIPYESVTVERDGDRYYIQGETDLLNVAYNLYPDIDHEDDRKAQLAKDWKRIARVTNDAYGSIFNEDVPAGPRFRYNPDLGSFDATALSTRKVRNAVYQDEEALSLARAIRDGSLYNHIRNNITAATEDDDDGDLD